MMGVSVGEINSMLSSSSKRMQGLAALADVVYDCSVETLAEQHETWEKLLLQVFQSHDSTLAKRVAAYIFSVMLCRMAAYAELHRHSLNSSIPALMALNVSTDIEWLVFMGECLIKIIPAFHGTLTAYATRIETIAYSLIRTQNSRVAMETGAELLALLPACYAMSKRSDVWSNIADKVLGSLCNIVNEICDCLGMAKRIESQTSIGFIRVENESIWESRVLIDHVHALAHCWQHLTNVQYTVIANLPVDRFMEAMGVVFGVSAKYVLLKLTEDRLSLASMLPAIHMAFCDMVTSLVTSVHHRLTPHAHQVSTWYTHLLTIWSAENLPTRLDIRVLNNVRPKIYAAIEVWVCAMGGNSLIDTHAGDMLRHMIADIQAALPNTLATVSTSNGEASSSSKQPPTKKAKKKAAEYTASWQAASVQNVSVVLREGEADVCVAAISALRQTIVHVGALLSDDQFREAMDCILGVARYLTSSLWSNHNTAYRADESREALYRCLVAMVTCDKVASVPYVSEAVVILTQGQRDTSGRVADVCRTGTMFVQNVVHPRRAPHVVHQAPSSSVNATVPSVNYTVTYASSTMSPWQGASINTTVARPTVAEARITHRPVDGDKSVSAAADEEAMEVTAAPPSASVMPVKQASLEERTSITVGNNLHDLDLTISKATSHNGDVELEMGQCSPVASTASDVLPVSSTLSVLAVTSDKAGVSATVTQPLTSGDSVSAEVADILKCFVDDSADSDEEITPVFT